MIASTGKAALGRTAKMERQVGRSRLTRRAWAVCRSIALVVIFIWLVGPSAIALITSLEPTADLVSNHPIWTFAPQFGNFTQLFAQGGLLHSFLNSALSSGLSAIVALVIGVPAAYALSRARVRGYWAIVAALLSARALPAVGIAIPLFVVFTHLHLIDTVWALVIAYLPFNVALVVWLMREYLESVPRELDEAAQVDGCGRVQTLVFVVLPVTLPALASTTIFAFLYGWNNFFYPLVLTNHNATTVPVALTQFIGEYTVNWGEIMAGVVVLSVPMIALAYAVKRYMVGGLSQGAIK